MDNMHMDLRVGFDDDFSFGCQALPCTPSASFCQPSIAGNTQDPFTPTSGRSTPRFLTVLMDHENVVRGTPASFALTPPASTFNGYFPSEKSDIHHNISYESLSSTPSRKSSLQSVTMDFDMIANATASRKSPYQAPNSQHPNSQQLGQNYAHHMVSPPLQFSNPQYSLEDSYGMIQQWGWAEDDAHSINTLGSENMPSISPLQNGPSSYRLHESKRSQWIQETSVALHNAQNYAAPEPHIVQNPPFMGDSRVRVVAKGKYACPHEDCKAIERTFKRAEHMKRHYNTVHGDSPRVVCPYCSKQFNRRDNWRSHLELHATIKPTGRTAYKEDAARLLKEELKKTKQRKQPRNLKGPARASRVKVETPEIPTTSTST